MRFCPKCGTDVVDGARFCPSCGNVMPAAVPTSAPKDPYIDRTLDGKFLIQELLGVGGMGKVYKAVQLSLDKVVCVKVLRSAMMQDETLVRRFQREARAASRLNHPNSITVIDFGQAKEDGSLYLAMEYVPGKDLNKIIAEDRPLPEKRIVLIMDQVLSALADAHAAGIIHRDLKPENIMVADLRGTKDFVKVLDFGIAKIQESTVAEPGLTQAGMVCGTPEYMSPEQARGEELDARSDVYAAGIILYQMVVGQLPFTAPTAMGIVTKHLTEPPVPPSQHPGIKVSPALEAVILKAMSKDRNGRQPTALALQQELNAVLNQQVAPAQQAPLGKSLFADEDPTVESDRLQSRTLIRPATAAAPGPAHPPVQAAAAKTSGGHGWLVAIILIVLVLGGGGAAGYFLWWVPNHQGQADGGTVQATDAGGVPPAVEPAPAPDAGTAVAAADPGGAVEVPDAGTVVASAPDPGAPAPSAEVSEEARMNFQAGKELVAQEKCGKAIPFFERAIKKSPGFGNAYKSLGMCHMNLGHSAEAKKYFRLYLDKAPNAEDRKDIQDMIDSL